ncbi:MAG: glycosyltransferase family 25 protein [Ramlibacter sp.]|uniref:glycosyltransferase family 25 protein n=1 Tax=Ramlibacter sp. TaxID=1917967 RepID=UPI002615F424|nr:glycosyltransferase family 25 protein [Ramlibacter sp.]MDH4377546.1 glycosyltransferase family 25 protein [Ramlibacter sp.]
MDAFYINLEAATLRRQAIESSFRLAARPGWALHRFPATAIAAPAYAGPRLRHVGSGRRLSMAEEGCYLSHRSVIERQARLGAPFMVLEDDVVFASPSVSLIDGFMKSGQAHDWDLIFTDVIFPDANGMLNLFRLRQSLRPGEVRVLDLAARGFAGTSAYIVMPKAAAMLAEQLNAPALESVPFDMAVRRLIYDKVLRACVLFPFPTSVGETAQASQIQDTAASTADLLWNTFRQMVWIGADRAAVEGVLRQIDERHVDAPARDLGIVLSAMASRSYVPK